MGEDAHCYFVAREQPADLLAASEFAEHVGPESNQSHVHGALARARQITAPFSGIGPEMAAEMGRMSLEVDH